MFKATTLIRAGKLAIHMLLDKLHDPDIMVALGPQAKRFVQLGQFYQLIEGQGQGHEGPLLVNGYANIGYIVDDNGAVWAFGAHWRGGRGWYVELCSVAYGFPWYGGYQVVSQP